MSDTKEVIQSTIDRVLERIDLLASKLGIAAKEVWRFSVTAKVVEAKRDLAKSAALLLITFLLWGWAVRVAMIKIPHDIKTQTHTEMVQGPSQPCDQIGMVNGKQVVMHEQCWQNLPKDVPSTEDQGISIIGWLLVASGIACAIVGLLVAVQSVSGVLDGLAGIKTAEYDAYQDLIYDWKD